MSRVLQYPHTMSWTGEGTPASVDTDTGFPIPGVPGEVVSVKCRYENFNKTNRKEWTNEDGKTIAQIGTIFVPFGHEIPRKFKRVRIVDRDGDEVFEGPILNVYKGQMNTTLAV